MKGSNPIIPPGAQFDGARRGRSNMRMAVVVVVLMHMALFAGILFNACKQKDEGEAQKETEQEMAGIVNRQPEPATLPEPVTPNPLSNLPALPDAGSALPPLPTEGSAAVPPVPLPITPAVPLPVAPAPSIPSPALPTPAVGGTEYVIASGDNFWTIGRKFGVSAKQLEQANPNVVPTRMKIGQKINIPTPAPASIPEPTEAPVVDDASTYIVKSGDTLGHIALRHKVKIAELKALNGLSTDLIRIGQKIKLPATALPTGPTTGVGFPGATPPSLPLPPAFPPSRGPAPHVGERCAAPAPWPPQPSAAALSGASRPPRQGAWAAGRPNGAPGAAPASNRRRTRA